MISKIIKYFISGWLEKNSNAEKEREAFKLLILLLVCPPTEKCVPCK